MVEIFSVVPILGLFLNMFGASLMVAPDFPDRPFFNRYRKILYKHDRWNSKVEPARSKLVPVGPEGGVLTDSSAIEAIKPLFPESKMFDGSLTKICVKQVLSSRSSYYPTMYGLGSNPACEYELTFDNGSKTTVDRNLIRAIHEKNQRRYIKFGVFTLFIGFLLQLIGVLANVLSSLS
ncbi:hypothetical protein [Halomarina pelagica]|uniref:hypothetical protein n=1 Tax=Halomarina pelagica TaxID=2961599 RepID=UPI0020C48273|nr:hypothetical protein [Halomarina sp. BND7]